MNAFARSLALLSVIGHIVLTTAHAYASADGPGLLQLADGNGPAAGPSGGHGAGAPQTIYTPGAPPPPPPDISGPGGGDASGACAAGLQLPDPADYAELIEGVAAISHKTQEYIERCGCKTQACVADALDKYADALAKAAASPPGVPADRLLPRALRDLPKIVRQAAARVRAAATKEAAEKAVQAAIVTVRRTVARTISLVRAADLDAKSVATRGGALVVDTLKTAGEALARADTL